MQEVKLSHFIPALQQLVLADLVRGEEAKSFLDKLAELKQTIQAMPVTYEQEGLGDDAVVHLHYFAGSANWYITEKDMTGDGTLQAFGWAEMFPGEGEFGYISIAELVRSRRVELDLHWTPLTVREARGQA